MSYVPFEDTALWKVGMELVKEIYAAIATNQSFTRDYALANQMRRSAISIPSNIAEGFERASNKELIQFLYISKGSAGELRTQLMLAIELEYMNEADASKLIEKAKSVSKMTQGLIKYLQNSELKGIKYNNVVREPEPEYQKALTDIDLIEAYLSSDNVES